MSIHMLLPFFLSYPDAQGRKEVSERLVFVPSDY